MATLEVLALIDELKPDVPRGLNPAALRPSSRRQSPAGIFQNPNIFYKLDTIPADSPSPQSAACSKIEFLCFIGSFPGG